MRPPTLRDLEELAELGHALELVVDLPNGSRARYDWESRRLPRLLWSPRAQALIIAAGSRKRGVAPIDCARAAATRGRWTGTSPEGAYRLELPELPGRWLVVGDARRTDYRSDKWGRAVDYTHDHGPGVRVWQRGDIRGGAGLLALRGGRLRITPHGIEG